MQIAVCVIFFVIFAYIVEIVEVTVNEMLNNRAISLAQHIIKTNQTVRQTACVYGISKSTVHNDVSNKLKKINYKLYKKVAVVLNKNFQEKHIRGGESTRKKYLEMHNKM